MDRDYQKEAQGLIEGRVLFDAPMRRFTSMRIGGPAECLIFPKDVNELRKVVLHARKKRIPLFILGKGHQPDCGGQGDSRMGGEPDPGDEENRTGTER